MNLTANLSDAALLAATVMLARDAGTWEIECSECGDLFETVQPNAKRCPECRKREASYYEPQARKGKEGRPGNLYAITGCDNAALDEDGEKDVADWLNMGTIDATHLRFALAEGILPPGLRLRSAEGEWVVTGGGVYAGGEAQEIRRVG
jgi:hypothetical protein